MNPIANKKDEEKVVQWTAPVGLPPPHKLESIKPLTGTNAESRGKLLADELLGKSYFTPPVLFRSPHSREGISTGTTSACDDELMEDMCTEASRTASSGDAATNQTPTTCFVGKEIGRTESPTHFRDSLSVLHQADKSPNHFKESSSIIHQTDMYSPSADEGNGASTKFGFPTDFESGRQSAPDGDGTCFVQIPSTYEGERPSATDGNETCFVQIPSTHEGERPSAVDSHRVWPTDLVDRVRLILQLPIRQPSKPEFSFELSLEAAE